VDDRFGTHSQQIAQRLPSGTRCTIPVAKTARCIRIGLTDLGDEQALGVR
jgi:hypothetical protein